MAIMGPPLNTATEEDVMETVKEVGAGKIVERGVFSRCLAQEITLTAPLIPLLSMFFLLTTPQKVGDEASSGVVRKNS